MARRDKKNEREYRSEEEDDEDDDDSSIDNSAEEDDNDEDENEEEEKPKRSTRKNRRRSRKNSSGKKKPAEDDDSDDDDDDSDSSSADLEDEEFTAAQVLKVNQFVQERLDREKRAAERRFDTRLKREKAAWEAEQKKQREREEMAETERLKQEKEDAEKEAQERVDKAHARVIRSEAKSVAAELGVKNAKKLKRLFKQVDFTDVEMDDSGEPDEQAIREAIEDVLEDIPELAEAVDSDNTTREKDAEQELADRMQNRQLGGGSRSADSTDDDMSLQDVRKMSKADRDAALQKYGVTPRSYGITRS